MPAGPNVLAALHVCKGVESTLTLQRANVASANDAIHADRIEALFERHQGRLHALALRMSHDDERAKDLVQETFLRAARAPRQLPHGDAAEPWLVRVLVNLCRDGWRRDRVRRQHRDRLPAPAQPSSQESRTVARETVRWALGQLPPRRRAVVVLRELEDRETAEIASLLGLAQVTVRWHLSEGRKQLRQLLVDRPGNEASP